MPACKLWGMGFTVQLELDPRKGVRVAKVRSPNLREELRAFGWLERLREPIAALDRAVRAGAPLPGTMRGKHGAVATPSEQAQR